LRREESEAERTGQLPPPRTIARVSVSESSSSPHPEGDSVGPVGRTIALLGSRVNDREPDSLLCASDLEERLGVDHFAPPPRASGRGQARPQSCRVASRAPSAIAANFSHATLAWVSLNRAAEAANPQSAPAITFSRPTILANRTIRSAISAGCSIRLVVWLMTPGMRILPSAGRNSSKTWYSCSCRGLAASKE